MQAEYRQIKFTDNDVVNPDDFIAGADYNPHKVRPWLIHDHGFTVAVVFADCLQDALDEAADNGKLDSFKVSDEDLADYGPEEDGISHLGNAGEAYDIGGLGVEELPTPPFSFVALFEAMKSEKQA